MYTPAGLLGFPHRALNSEHLGLGTAGDLDKGLGVSLRLQQ
jgi:hypothetical protein